ncbi:MAG: hypothetical protein SPJ90_10565 [Prevotella sp.]|nr:hypothetical protein [Prevotellaceae bacterium]MDY5844841.1 hypothetical protein [Prevotella sp.]
MHKVNDIPAPCAAHSAPVRGKVKWDTMPGTFFIKISWDKRIARTNGRNGWTGNVSER